MGSLSLHLYDQRLQAQKENPTSSRPSSSFTQETIPATLMKILQVLVGVERWPLSFTIGQGKSLNIHLYSRVNL